MEKKTYPTASYPGDLGKDVVEALHGISSRVVPDRREVFLSGDGYGYVWCFSRENSFSGSLLSRIQNGNWFPLSSIAERPDAEDIVRDLREAYNANPVRFSQLEFDNPSYDPCIIGDVIFGRDQKKRIKIFLAMEGGEEMARSLEGVLDKYKILESTSK